MLWLSWLVRSFSETGNHSLLFKAFASLDLIVNSPPLTAAPFLVNWYQKFGERLRKQLLLDKFEYSHYLHEALLDNVWILSGEVTF